MLFTAGYTKATGHIATGCSYDRTLRLPWLLSLITSVFYYT